MNESFAREELLIGSSGLKCLNASRILVAGIGGVGGSAVEALARAGIGTIGLLDYDRVSLSNVNRQLIAFPDTVGEKKSALWSARIKAINPSCQVIIHDLFYLPSDDTLDLSLYDGLIDAVDTVSAKIALAEVAKKNSIPLISAMGTANKLHPELFRISPLEETSGDALARVLRREFKKRGLASIPVVWSPEDATSQTERDAESGKIRRGTISCVPMVAGCLCASWIINYLLEKDKLNKK